jgi:hypothetical protein
MCAEGGRRLGFLTVALCAVFGPAASLEGDSDREIKARFTDYVNRANMCTMASECALAFTECPLGCYVAVRVDRKADVEAKARELVNDYERGGRNCAYGCVAPGPVTCTDNRCSVSPDLGDAGIRDTRESD